jgi:type IV pilus assembly protein PilC
MSMPDYQYRVITPQGKEKKDSMEGKSPEQVTALLKSQGNVIISVQEAGLMNKSLELPFGAKKVTARDFSVFCRQFVSIIAGGVSIINALEMMTESTENKTLKAALRGVHEDVSKGESMTVAIKKRSKIFPAMLSNMVEAGEATGSLETAFDRMAIQFEKDEKLKQSVKKAMMYPIVLVFLMTGIFFLMLLWVIPTFMGMFAELDAEMPAFTQLIIDMSDFMRANWWLVLLIMGGVIAAFRWYSSTASGKIVLGTVKLKLPVFGPLQVKTECARLGRTLCTLLSAGVPLVEAVEITARSMVNVHYRKAMENAKEQILRGRALSQPLKSSGLFPPMVVHMVSIGEETGNIEPMLENVANYYEDDVQVATDQMMALMEPAIIMVMAVVVGGMIIAILQPMMVLYESIQ